MYTKSSFLSRYMVLVFLFPLLLLSACGNLFESEPPDPGPVVSLDPGTEYYYRHTENSDTSFIHLKIVGDTLIQGKSYAIFDNGVYKRTEDGVVYLRKDNEEIIEMNFRVAIGDSVRFLGEELLVTNVERKEMFGFQQSVISVSNSMMAQDTIISGIYSTLYGIVSHTRSASGITIGDTLLGAIVSGKSYGTMP